MTDNIVLFSIIATFLGVSVILGVSAIIMIFKAKANKNKIDR